MTEYKKPCKDCKDCLKCRMSNNTGKWLPFDLDGSAHKCNPIETKAASTGKKKVNELIELVDLEERMEHAASICTEIRSKVSELELIIVGGAVSR